MSEVEHLTDDKTSDVNLGCAAADKASEIGEASGVGTSDASHKVTRVQLVSADGASFYVEQNVARKLKFEDVTIEGNTPILLDDIESDILAIMIKWAEKHVDDQEAEDDSEDDDDEVKRSDDIDEWDNELLNLEITTLFRLLKAATSREIGGLSKVAAKKSASKFKNKTVEQLKETVEELRETSLKTVEKADEES